MGAPLVMVPSTGQQPQAVVSKAPVDISISMDLAKTLVITAASLAISCGDGTNLGRIEVVLSCQALLLAQMAFKKD
jgi:hypothetical protein